MGVEDTDGLTPLHLAAHGGHTAMVERLVGYGADLNAATSQGNTALHLTLVRRNMAPPSLLSPHILEVSNTCTVEPPNKGQFRASLFVPCREVVPISEVK